ncbi:MAG: VWA domain-containing protein, partial [Nitrosomonadales bacterium]|nr:VWA domain-containing protein [Nitrosomonadales bacterium]
MKYFHHLQRYLVHRRDATLLLSAFILLVIALFQPSIPLKRNIYSYILVADISQSMNVPDMGSASKPVTRIAHTQKMMHEVVSAMPCGTKVSIALFAGVSVAAMYTPIEVCRNFAAINDTIDHLDWRSSWSGNSRIRDSMLTLAQVLRAFPEPAQVVYFTDGEEAPNLHAFNTRDLSSFQGGDDWLFVGVGSDKGTPIPKLDEKNQLIGYWSAESFALQPGIAQISESNIGTRDDNVAGGENDRYLSKLDEEYLKSLAKEINAKYVRGNNLQNILS